MFVEQEDIYICMISEALVQLLFWWLTENAHNLKAFFCTKIAAFNQHQQFLSQHMHSICTASLWLMVQLLYTFLDCILSFPNRAEKWSRSSSLALDGEGAMHFCVWRWWTSRFKVNICGTCRVQRQEDSSNPDSQLNTHNHSHHATHTHTQRESLKTFNNNTCLQ